ncbi:MULTISPECIES: mannose-1-phosphate guanylyltransferase/mannose-6-phosphate isomerase [unclassified Pseudodesulfovibrio]|uniref:mannose-1-phosphate guanylyltransferase/mannose-6-phosphate isomerase n=1 Tax=unclassified Pseudodesulfovibrio TaxID=2661612 RepID=UPI000FEBC94D|nr:MULTISPECIES: mannose-1-phosphate guanylyltransferase/mannose-6-phosphate isomerase [unclassified Pseudodesulfovibrio]MCJ2163238.1 mannose-1-phosphate guanylyltransferase/mannose-6-phosphate isomerase [Pseudodesulfovibrio sp. S3-i]RWU07221.1 mannose-1-phosphate guanylyltransferase/mannose-6-phosphate isomerase [Pseudodesulfovibrio sp. S3]
MNDTGSVKESFSQDCHAIILAGGSGTRLWPLSRNLLPKQLLVLGGETTLLQQTVTRVLEAFDPSRVWVVTNEEHVFEVRKQVASIDEALERQVLAEPLGRNTLPAIMLGLDKVVEADPKALAAVFPSDHLIRNGQAWVSDLMRASLLAADKQFVTFGVEPDKPETGYGYIALGKDLGQGAYRVEGFVEKPDFATAQRFVREGSHLWNSGMFLFSAKHFLTQVARCEPVLWDWWMSRDETPLVQGYRDIPNISVDYGVVEKIDNIAVIRAGFAWDDLGSWEAMYRVGDKDENGNVIQGDVLAMNCRNSLLISEGGKLAVSGLSDMIMVQTRDATLSCPMDQVQSVRDVVAALKAQGSQLVESHSTVYRPWGNYTVLEEGPQYKIKRIQVNPGARLSSQMHHHRSEHWVVVDGTAEVEVDNTPVILVENQSVDIPKASQHRLANPGKVPLNIIEIQSGPYLEEDDIVRFEDVYGRVKK